MASSIYSNTVHQGCWKFPRFLVLVYIMVKWLGSCLMGTQWSNWSSSAGQQTPARHPVIFLHRWFIFFWRFNYWQVKTVYKTKLYYWQLYYWLFNIWQVFSTQFHCENEESFEELCFSFNLDMWKNWRFTGDINVSCLNTGAGIVAQWIEPKLVKPAPHMGISSSDSCSASIQVPC